MIRGFHGGAVLLGNGIAGFNGGLCCEGISLQVVKCNVMVASRWCWVGDGGAVLLGNVIRGFHGGAVLLGVVKGSLEENFRVTESREVKSKS